jgi:hypothetical protein
MRSLEQRNSTEGFCEVGSKTREHEVIGKNIPLHLSGDTLDCARIRQAECFSLLLEGVVVFPKRLHGTIVC